MPRFKRYSRRPALRRRYRKSNFTKRVAKIAKAVTTRLSELKNNQPFSYAGGVAPIGRIPVQANNISSTLLTEIGGGATALTRTGNMCYLEKVHIRGHFINGATQPPTNTSGTIRLIVFWDRQPVIGTNATSGNVLDMGLGTAADMYGTPNWGNRRRFKIIRDKIIRPHPQADNIAASNQQANLSVMIKFKKGTRKLNWQDATGTNVMGPHLYWFMMSSEAADTFRFIGTVRLQWRDE